MATNFYEVITVGDDLAGLVASALLARRGFRVLLVEHAHVPDHVNVAGAEVPRAPLHLLGLDSLAWRRVVGELNLVQIFRRRVEPHRPSFQLVVPGHRLDVASDPETLARELGRELPGARASIDATLGRAADIAKVLDPLLGQEITLPPDGFWDRRELSRYDTRLPRPEDDLFAEVDDLAARALLRAPGLLSTSLWQDDDVVGPVAAARALELWRRGVAHIDGGMATLRALLIERLRTHAGEVVRADVESFELKRSRVVGVKLVGQAEPLGASYVLSALPLARTLPLLPGAPPKRLVQAGTQLRPLGQRYILDVVLASSGLPEGMSTHLVSVRDPAAPLLGANLLGLTVLPVADEPKVVITVECIAPTGADLPALRAEVMQHLGELMPFVTPHILGSFSPTEGGAPEEGKKAVPPAPTEYVYAQATPAPLGVCGLKNDTGISKLLLCSRENLPGLGIEGDLVTAWSVARTLCLAERKKDYLKDVVLQG